MSWRMRRLGRERSRLGARRGQTCSLRGISDATCVRRWECIQSIFVLNDLLYPHD